MLIELVARYYRFLWLAFAAIGFVKIIISFSFNHNLKGINGILYGLFKWYNEDDQEMEDLGPRRITMRFHNMVTLLLYFIILLIVAASMLTMFIGTR